MSRDHQSDGHIKESQSHSLYRQFLLTGIIPAVLKALNYFNTPKTGKSQKQMRSLIAESEEGEQKNFMS